MWNRSRPHDRRERLFGGSGAVFVWSLCDSGPRPPFGAILACELEGAGSVGPHLQQEFAEVVIVVEGEGVARVGGTATVMQPGVVLEIALGQTLALENVSLEHPAPLPDRQGKVRQPTTRLAHAEPNRTTARACIACDLEHLQLACSMLECGYAQAESIS